ncbi:hypothetical protein [Tunturiibacter gelidiferens]|uniref:hypothetical protein n=1 Tax=Tunturiibacter gelidiferens TaxID=3069689 RepID=UPI003D9ACE3C
MFVVEVKDDAGGVVAEVERVIYCATKNAHEERKNCGAAAGEGFVVLLVFLGGF